ncbi:MAG: Fic family protein [Gemmatimonadaceae bacterium]
MDPAAFKNAKSGRLVKTLNGAWAFVPSDPITTIEYDDDLVLALSSADTALSELAGLGRQIPNPHLLIAPYMRREALLSSRIEGTVASLADVLEEEAGVPRSTGVRDDVQEVLNYVDALEHGMERLGTLPLSKRLVRELHKRLMAGVRGQDKAPGKFRTTQNWLGPSDSDVRSAVYVPPPPQEVENSLDSWEKFLHLRGKLPDLIQCAIMHEHFESIHPFLDGNGRIGRLLIPLFLKERGRLPVPLLYLSAYIERTKTKYYEYLQGIRTNGAIRDWLLYFLDGITIVSKDAIVQAGALVDLRETYRARVKNDARALVVVDSLFTNPYLVVSHAQELLQVSNPTARRTVRKLEDAGILRPLARRASGRVFLARDIFDVVERPAASKRPHRG